jgi:hypothetical protein
MTEAESFLEFPSLREAEEFMGFQPLARRFAGMPTAIRAQVRDHRLHDAAPTLEVFIDGFVLSQAGCGSREATNRAHDEFYGPAGSLASVGGYSATCVELGEEPPPDDRDPRRPSVVAWADGELFYLMASDQFHLTRLLEVARSLYEPRPVG